MTILSLPVGLEEGETKGREAECVCSGNDFRHSKSTHSPNGFYFPAALRSAIFHHSVPCSNARHVSLPFALGCKSQHSNPVWIRSVTWLLTLHCISVPHEWSNVKREDKEMSGVVHSHKPILFSLAAATAPCVTCTFNKLEVGVFLAALRQMLSMFQLSFAEYKEAVVRLLLNLGLSKPTANVVHRRDHWFHSTMATAVIKSCEDICSSRAHFTIHVYKYGFVFISCDVRKKRNHLNHMLCGRGQHYPQLLQLNLQTTAKVLCMSVSCARLDVK